MQTIQLYVDGQRVDMFSDESIQLTSSIQDVKDISKVFTDYSQMFNVPASKTNNKIFKHYYNNAIQNGYDARFRSEAIIEINHSPFRKGTIRLNKVRMKNNKAYSYELTFFGSTVSLSRILGDDKLKNLDLSTYNHEWTYDNVLEGLQTGLEFNGDTAAVIYPLLSPKRRFIYDSDPNYIEIDNYANIGSALAGQGFLQQDLKPAIRLIRIIEAIEEKYPLTFSRDFFGGAVFNDLYMWLHRNSGVIENADDVSKMIISNWVFNNQSLLCGSAKATFFDNYFAFTSTFSNLEDYIDGDAQLTITPDDINAEYSYKIVDLVSNTIMFEETDVKGVKVSTVEMSTPSGESSKDFEVQVQISTKSSSGFLLYDAEWYVRTYYIGRGGDLECLNEQYYDALAQNMIGDVIMTNQTPDIKIIDLLTGLFKMFNLTAYVNDLGTIVVDTLDNFYSTYNTYDISNYVNVSDSDIERLPLYANINFDFREPSTFLAVEFSESNGQNFGSEEFNVIINGEYIDGDDYDITLPFEKVIYERLVDDFDGGDTNACYGWFVSENEDGINGNPLLFFNVNEPIGGIGEKNIYFRSSDGITVSNPTSYNRPSNVTSDETQTLNFDAENDEFNLEFNYNSLFENYYKTYIESVFNQYNRITKIKVLLPIKVLSKYKLNDRMVINDKRYKINSVTSNLMNGNSQVELIEDL